MFKIKQFVRNWSLPIAMTVGALGYFAFKAMSFSGEVNRFAFIAISRYIQPVLIFLMLFLSFLKVKPSEMKPRRWHLYVLLLQAGSFLVCSLLALLMPNQGLKVLCEGAMLAFICPTATASAVITGRLGGSTSGVVTYIMICNLMVSFLAPAVLPIVEPHEGLSFFPSFLLIMSKVFPLLICPLLLAQLVRYFMPRLFKKLMSYPDLAFNIWVPALAFAITVTVRSIVHSSVDWRYMVGLAIISLICCLLQFWMGRRVGSIFDQTESDDTRSIAVTAGQAFGQKNTVFVIWLGLIFLNPVTSVIGGFYSVWHNTVNSWQLYKVRKKTA